MIAHSSTTLPSNELAQGTLVDRPVVCVQGLGFVGSAMAISVAAGRRGDGSPAFDVIGVDLATDQGRDRIDSLNAGRFPAVMTDLRLSAALTEARERGNLVATADEQAYDRADVTIVDVPLDVVHETGGPRVDFTGFRHAIRTLGSRMPAGSLVIVETTVPPGTCDKVVAPEIATALHERGLPPDAIHIAHSYERVMPGQAYLDSIVNFWRIYAGHTRDAADACERFLSQVINVADYPLTRLHSTTASETAKVLENSYRATTIALMEEWGRFAEAVGVDLFSVIAAIRRRPTHSNMRQPGFGVGGYCLTKDPLLGAVSASQLFGVPELDFPFSSMAVEVNRDMPRASLRMLDAALEGLTGKTVLLLGVSYREDVADTRFSPAEVFVVAAREQCATVVCHDPLVNHWAETGMALAPALPSPDGVDAVVFAVAHREYRELDLATWLGGARPYVLDANMVLSAEQRQALANVGCRSGSIGRGA